MVKRCIVCEEEAAYKIRDTSDYYCQDCADDNFADLTLLVKLEEEAQRLKERLSDAIDDLKLDLNHLENTMGKEE